MPRNLSSSVPSSAPVATSARDLALAAAKRVTGLAFAPPPRLQSLLAAEPAALGSAPADAPCNEGGRTALLTAVRAIARTTFASSLAGSGSEQAAPAAVPVPLPKAAGIAASGRREAPRGKLHEGLAVLSSSGGGGAAAAGGRRGDAAPPLLVAQGPGPDTTAAAAAAAPAAASAAASTAAVRVALAAAVDLQRGPVAAADGVSATARSAATRKGGAAPPLPAGELPGQTLLTAPLVQGGPKRARVPTAGAQWFDLGAPELTPELRQELMLVKHRAYLDPKQHFKTAGEDQKAPLPRFFAMGTVQEGPHEFHTARIVQRDRQPTLVAALLADERLRSHAVKYAGQAAAAGAAGGRAAYTARKRQAAGARHLMADDGGSGRKRKRG